MRDLAERKPSKRKRCRRFSSLNSTTLSRHRSFKTTSYLQNIFKKPVNQKPKPPFGSSSSRFKHPSHTHKVNRRTTRKNTPSPSPKKKKRCVRPSPSPTKKKRGIVQIRKQIEDMKEKIEEKKYEKEQRYKNKDYQALAGFDTKIIELEKKLDTLEGEFNAGPVPSNVKSFPKHKRKVGISETGKTLTRTNIIHETAKPQYRALKRTISQVTSEGTFHGIEIVSSKNPFDEVAEVLAEDFKQKVGIYEIQDEDHPAVKHSPVNEKVFACLAETDFERHEIIGEYTGTILTESEGTVDSYQCTLTGSTCGEYNEPLIITGAKECSELAFANDARDLSSETNFLKNAELFCVIVDGHYKVLLQATRDIQKYEEILLSYGKAYWDTHVTRAGICALKKNKEARESALKKNKEAREINKLVLKSAASSKRHV